MNGSSFSPGRLVGTVVEICRFRGSPQEIPESQSLLAILLVCSVLLDLASGNLLELKEPLLARSLMSTLLLLALSWIALAIRGMSHRYVQTASALVACSIAFSLLILPLAMLFGNPQGVEVALTAGQRLIVWLGLATLIWKIAVDAHVVRQAIEAPFWLGFLLALSWAVADFALSRVLFATPA